MISAHDFVREIVDRAFAGKIPISARERYADLLKSRSAKFKFRYEEIRDIRVYEFAMNHPRLIVSDGEETFGIEVCQEQ